MSRIRPRVQVDFTDAVPRTKQSFKDEVDINNIVAKYQRTGLIDHVQEKRPIYGDVTSQDFKTAMDTVAKAKSLFEELPSESRKRFNGSVEEFLNWAQDPASDEELDALERGEWPEEKPAEEAQPVVVADAAASPGTGEIGADDVGSTATS